jgi:hypothetical protein
MSGGVDCCIASGDEAVDAGGSGFRALREDDAAGGVSCRDGASGAVVGAVCADRAVPIPPPKTRAGFSIGLLFRPINGVADATSRARMRGITGRPSNCIWPDAISLSPRTSGRTFPTSSGILNGLSSNASRPSFRQQRPPAPARTGAATTAVRPPHSAWPSR